jgi:hypothetical protein
MKAVFLGMLLASPPVAAWMLRGSHTARENHDIQPITEISSPAPVRIPVEVVAKGSASQWVYVDAPSHAVPEPGVASLMAVASLLLLRRQRPGGK